MEELKAIPLTLTGWFRYLLGVDDNLEPMELSSDPAKEKIRKQLCGVKAGVPSSYSGQLRDILKNETIFGVDLVEAGLAERIEDIFREELEGIGAVRKTLNKYLKSN